MKAIALVALLAVVYAVTAQVTILTARMNGKNNVNACCTTTDTGSPYSGVFIAFYDQSSSVINYFILHNIPTVNTTMAHIHGPANATNTAGVLFNVTNAAGLNYYTGSWTDTGAAQMSNLFNGLTYFNVHSVAFPSGEIRGQIYPTNSSGYTHIALLDFISDNTYSPTPSYAVGLGLLTLNTTTNAMTVTVQHNVSNPTQAHIHGNATFCANAGVLYAFSNPANEINQVFTYSAADVQGVNAQLQYVNVHSAAFPNGEARGQIIPVSTYVANNKNTFYLSGCNPTNTPTPTPAASTTAAPGTTSAPVPTTTKSSASVVAASVMTIGLAAVAML